MHIVRLLLVIGALVGLVGQTQARTRLPQPLAMAERMADDCMDGMPGMEPPSDLFGEAAITEAQERQPCGGDLLDCISVKGWSVSAIHGDVLGLVLPVIGRTPMPVGMLPERAPYRLFDRTFDPPRA